MGFGNGWVLEWGGAPEEWIGVLGESGRVWCVRLAFEAGLHLAGGAGEFLLDDGGEHIGCVVPAVGTELAVVCEQVGGQVGPAILPIGGHNDSA